MRSSFSSSWSLSLIHYQCYVGLLLLLLLGSSSGDSSPRRRTQDDLLETSSNGTEAPTSAMTTLGTMEPTTEQTPEPTPQPTLEPTLAPVLTAPPVLNPGEVDAYFLLDFYITNGTLADGHLNETERLAFQEYMAGLQGNYLPREIDELIVVDCFFLEAGFFVDGNEFIVFPERLTEAPSAAPTVAPAVPLPTVIDVVEGATSAPVTRAPQPTASSPTVVGGNSGRSRWLEAVRWKTTQSTRSSSRTSPTRRSEQFNTTRTFLQNSTIKAIRTRTNPSPIKTTAMTRPRSLQQQLTGSNGTVHYQYAFHMNYRSNALRANLTDQPGNFQDYVNSNKQNVSAELAMILNVSPLERLAIITMNETVPITPEPTTSPSEQPSSSFRPSSQPSVSTAPSLSSSPSTLPSSQPTMPPSNPPTPSPSSYPTFINNLTVFENVEVHFTLIAPPTAGYMNESQELEFCYEMIGRTAVFAPDAVDRVVTECTFFIESFIVETIPVTLAPTPVSAATPVPAATPQTRRRKLNLRQQVVQPPATLLNTINNNNSTNTTLKTNSTNATATFRRRHVPRSKYSRRMNHTVARQQQDQLLLQPPFQETTTSHRTLQEQTQTGEASEVKHTYIYPFRMRYTSQSENLENFTTLFLYNLADSAAWFNPMLTEILHLNASNELQIQQVTTFITKSSAPTMSLMPSESPTEYPTPPQPTYFPTLNPTVKTPPTDFPSSSPSVTVPNVTASRLEPTPSNNDGGSNSNENTLIIVIIIVAIGSLASLAGMAWFYKTRQSKMQQLLMENMSAHEEHSGRGGVAVARRGSKFARHVNSRGGGGRYDVPLGTGTMSGSGEGMVPAGIYNPNNIHNSGMPNSTNTNANNNTNLLMSPSTSESILSNPSLLSNGQGDEDDDDVVDDLVVGHDDDDDGVDDPLERHSKLSPLDDFDRFKDQNLEKMRSDVEDNVTGMDGMMSQALTMALMPGGDNAASGVLWAGARDPMEIEANALWEVNDWMKRNEGTPVDEKQSFMQDMLNKMVTSVRQGILGPDDASRTIHECAFLLNLQLANDLPPTTVILSGMRKTVRANDVIRAFRRFGQIDDAAVASNQRGFGIVRFRFPKAAEDAHTKFKTGEIVVQDVAVQVRVLKPEGQ